MWLHLERIRKSSEDVPPEAHAGASLQATVPSFQDFRGPTKLPLTEEHAKETGSLYNV